MRDLIAMKQLENIPVYLRGDPDHVVALIMYCDSNIFGPGNYLEECPAEPYLADQRPPELDRGETTNYSAGVKRQIDANALDLSCSKKQKH